MLRIVTLFFYGVMKKDKWFKKALVVKAHLPVSDFVGRPSSKRELGALSSTH